MKAVRVLAASMLVLVTVASITGCGAKPAASQSQGGQATPAEKPAFALDSANAVEQTIETAAGGTVVIKSAAQGDIVQVSFPRGSLSKDTQLIVTPLSEAPKGAQGDSSQRRAG